MPTSSYRPREEGLAAARRLAARQLGAGQSGAGRRRTVEEALADLEDEEGDDAPDDGAWEDDEEAFGRGLLPAGVADRLTPRLRSVRWRPSRRAAAGAGLVLLAVLAVAGLLLWRSWPSGAAPGGEVVPTRVAATTGPVAPQPSPTTSGEVVVHVAGRVVAPGLITLSAGSRVVDAVAAAGGAAPDADLDGVNLARPLVDGEQVLVPGPGVAAAGPAPVGPAGGPGPVDLNTATVDDLDALPGVGEVLAARIVAWREENGAFSSVEDLGEVVGIGPKVLDGVRDLVTV